jgi:hypothetical protein
MKVNFILLCFVSIILTSCDDLSSPYPAGKICSSYIDTNLIGYWESVYVENFTESNLPVDTHILAIMPFNSKEYVLQSLVIDDSGKVQIKDMGTYRGFISTIGKQKIANIQMLAPEVKEKEEYLIYPFVLKDDTLTFFSFYSKNVNQEFKSTCDLRKFLKKNMYNKSLYSSIRKYKRKNEKSFKIF